MANTHKDTRHKGHAGNHGHGKQHTAHGGGGHDHDHDDTRIPDTITPESIAVKNFWGMVAIWVAVSTLLFPIADSTSPILSGILTWIFWGWLVRTQKTSIDVPHWAGTMLYDAIGKKRRVVFSGLHRKLFWETVLNDAQGQRFTALTRDVSSRKTFTLTTKDQVRSMVVTLFIHTRLDTRPKSAEEDAKNFVAFRSVTEHALTEILDAEGRQRLAAYYNQHHVEELGDEMEVEHAVLEENPDNHHWLHEELPKRLGSHVVCTIEQSDTSPETKTMMAGPIRAKQVRDSMDILAQKRPNSQGITDPDKAMDGAMALAGDSNYTVGVSRFTGEMKGLENLTSFNWVGGGTPQQPKGKGGKKK